MTSFNLLVVLVCPPILDFCGSLDGIHLFVCFCSNKLVAYISPIFNGKGSVLCVLSLQISGGWKAHYEVPVVESAFSHVVLMAAQHSRKAAANKLQVRLAGQRRDLPSTPILFPCITFPATLLANPAPKAFQLVLSAASYGRGVAAGILWAARSFTVLWPKPQMVLHQIYPCSQVPSWHRPLHAELCDRAGPGAGAPFETCTFTFFLSSLSHSHPSFSFCRPFWFFFLFLGKWCDWRVLLAPVASVLKGFREMRKRKVSGFCSWEGVCCGVVRVADDTRKFLLYQLWKKVGFCDLWQNI